MRRVGFAAAIAAIFVVNVANAACYGTDTFQNCGDNSGNSLDGRFWGAVPVENVLGLVRIRYAPLGRIRLVK